MADTCVTKENIAKQSCRVNYGKVVAWWLDEIDTGLTFSNALSEVNWIAKINAAEGSRMYVPFPIAATEVTKTKAESTRVEGNTGEVYEAAKGKIEYSFKIDGLTADAALKMKSFDGALMYAYAITSEGYIMSKKDSTNIIPFPVTVSIDEISDADESTGFSYIMGKIYYKDRENYYESAVLPTDFTPADLSGINDITVTIISSSAAGTNIVFDVTGQSGEPIVALTTFGDWVVTLTAGSVARTETVITSVGNRYTLTVTDITAAAHTLAFKNQPSATVKGYELQTAVSFVCGA